MKARIGPLRQVLKLMALAQNEEAGLVIGAREGDTVHAYILYRTDNLKQSPREFESDPWQVVQAHRAAEKLGLEVLGVYHTHTSCPPDPSGKDVEGMKRWPGVWLIACPGEVKAWRLEGEEPVEVELEG
ncbi:M67 family metallopeptidase [Aeropyrum camini]|uniref:Predicted metal-dependent protease of the PAD1/JAB1 superfamily n=1 Tax=Aeropyrum camini SY1 = JCM 12091 TaxID=1198449 RepID=U3TF61_9CREN|nr:M67 family metallopeptidase [Aeropyrum camini]BAN89974.1 predicted metal-dependent protease of the PAD1/JAB1 superfamily [Aeropyrum camini SY1 = JCM 12091]